MRSTTCGENVDVVDGESFTRPELSSRFRRVSSSSAEVLYKRKLNVDRSNSVYQIHVLNRYPITCKLYFIVNMNTLFCSLFAEKKYMEISAEGLSGMVSG